MPIYFLAFVCLLVLDLYILLAYHEHRLRFQLNAGLILVTSFYAYNGALPFSRIFLGSQSPDPDLDISFMTDNLLAALGLTLGLMLCSKFFGVSRNNLNQLKIVAFRSKPALRKRSAAFLAVGSVVAAGYYFSLMSHFSFQSFVGAYGASNDITNANQTLSDSLLIPFAICAMLHGFFAIRIGALKGKLQLVVRLSLIVFLAIFIAQGHRNLMTYLGLPILAILRYGRPIKLGTFAACALLAFVGFYGIGIVRNWGWMDLDRVTVGNDALDPLRGELGTGFSVYEKLVSRPANPELKYGKTYTIDSLINLVPHPMWRNRPPSPAEQFSRDYFGTEQLTSGLGFSPLVECMINFSRLGIVAVFMIMPVVFIQIDKWARARGRAGILISAVLLPSIINWNRIDFAACSKMFLIYSAFVWGLDWILYRPVALPGPASPYVSHLDRGLARQPILPHLAR